MTRLTIERLLTLYKREYTDIIIPTRTVNNLMTRKDEDALEVVKTHPWVKLVNGSTLKERLLTICNSYNAINSTIEFKFVLKPIHKKISNTEHNCYDQSQLLSICINTLILTYEHFQRITFNEDIQHQKTNDYDETDLETCIDYMKINYKDNTSFKIFIVDHLFDGDEEFDIMNHDCYDAYNECERNFPVRHFINRLLKIQQTTTKNKHVDKLCAYSINPLAKEHSEYRNKLISFYSSILNYMCVIPCERVDLNSLNRDGYVEDAFKRSLCNYNDATFESFEEFVMNSIPKNSLNDYRKHDLAERINGMYRRFGLDIDCKDLDFMNFRCDVEWLNNFIFTYKPFSDMKVKWAIDYNFDDLNKDIKSVIKTIDDVLEILQCNIYNSSNHEFKCWYNPNLSQTKPLSIHVYFPGYCFKTDDMYGFSKFMKKSLNLVYINNEKMSRNSYIDTSVYKSGQQVFRVPFSGKLCCNPPREPIERVIEDKEGYTSKDLIEFYKDCSVLPTVDDVYHSFFELYEDYEINNAPYMSSKSEVIPRTLNIDLNSSLTSLYSNKDIESESIEIPNNGVIILIEMMLDVIKHKEQEGINYIDHRALRLVFIRNCYALGLNSVTVAELNKNIGIHHSDGSHESVNNQAKDDVSYIFREIGFVDDEQKTFEWCDSILQNEYKQPIIFDFTPRIEELLTQNLIDIHVFKLIARHLFLVYKRNYVMIRDNQQTYNYMFTEPVHFDNVNKMILNSDLKICANNKYYITSLSNLLKLIKPCLFKASVKKLELKKEDDPTTTYITYTMPTVGNKSKTFKDRPKAIDFILHSMLDNTTSGLTQEELNERVNYFESFIAYKFQHPGAHITHAIIVKTRQGVGKSIYARILREINPHVKDNEQLDRVLQQFNSGSGDNIITFFNEVADTTQHSNLKMFITEEYIPTEVKFGPRMYELNNNLKIFYTNDESFSFIDHDDRRFIVFIGTKTQQDVERQYNIPGFVFASPVEDIINNELKKEYFNYLINLKLDGFNPNVKTNSVAITCNKKEMIEKHNMSEDNLTNFFNTILEHIKLAEIKSNIDGVENKKCVSTDHIVHIFDFFKYNHHKSFEPNDDFEPTFDQSELDYIDLIFNSRDEFEELKQTYTRDFVHDDNTRWSTTTLCRRMKNNNKVDVKRVRENQLVVPQELKRYYTGRVIIYIIMH